MAVKLGTTGINKVYLGANEMNKVYLGSTEVYSAGGAAFSPADLFASLEQGAWYDPSDLTTLWTDTAGTTQATVGDAVARMDDKSGNGNHMTQATAAARPILRQSGSLYYLEFDGVDDTLINQDSTFMSTFNSSDSAMAAGYSGSEGYFSFAEQNSVDDFFGIQSSGANSRSFVWRPSGSFVGSGIPYVTPSIVYGIFNQTTRTTTSRVNGVDNAESAATGAGSLNVDKISIFALLRGTSGDLFFDGNFHGGVAIDRFLTATEVSDLDTYLADKTGVTL